MNFLDKEEKKFVGKAFLDNKLSKDDIKALYECTKTSCDNNPQIKEKVA